jgi:hypothetical protein
VKRVVRRMAKRTVKMSAKSLEGLLAGEYGHGSDSAFDVVRRKTTNFKARELVSCVSGRSTSRHRPTTPC